MKAEISGLTGCAGRGKARRGFTLTELLVVMAVLAILAVLGAAGVSAAMRATQTSVCVQNLKTISGAMLLYLNDHDGTFPIDLGYDGAGNSIGWMEEISGYGVTWNPAPPEPAVWYCPAADLNSSDRVSWGGPSYGCNDQLCPVMDYPTSQVSLKKLIQLPHISTTMMIWDSGAGGNPHSGHWKGVGARWLTDPWPLMSDSDYGEGAPAPRHIGNGVQNSSFITSFCDGHVEVIAPSDPTIQTYAERASLTTVP